MTEDPDTSEEPPAPRDASAPTRGRRWTARGLILLAMLLGTISIFATWAREQLLNTDQWVKTSTELLENRQISDEVAAFLVDELYANVDVSGQLSDRLPPDLQPLAPAAAAAVRQGLDRVSQRALQNARTQDLWANANRAAHEQFVAVVLEEQTGPVTAQQGVVVLDLRSILIGIGQRIGIPDSALQKIPDSAAEIEVLQSDELATAQNAAKLLKTGSFVLTALTLLLLALAIGLARGERRATLLLAGWALVAAGVAVLLARGVAGAAVVDALASTASVEPAVTAAWDIGTSLLVTLGWQAVVIGLAAVAAALLAGPARPATAIRRAAAPALARRPDLVGLGVGIALLLLVAWAPIPALRRPSFLLFLLVAVVVGVVALRRQTAREFPDAEGAGIDVAALWQRAGTALGGLRRPGAAEPTGDPTEARIVQLERLARLRDAGVLTEEELAAEKGRILHT